MLPPFVLPERIHRFDSIGSTSTALADMAKAGAPSGTVVLADRQVAGRGTHRRKWFSPSGGLYLSMLVGFEHFRGDATDLAIVAVVAVGRTLDSFLSGDVDVKYRWANDILVDGRKISGVLIEPVDHLGSCAQPLFCVGVGVNLAVLPLDAPPFTTTLAEYVAAPSPASFAELLLKRFEAVLVVCRNAGLEVVKEEWRKRSVFDGALFGPALADFRDLSPEALSRSRTLTLASIAEKSRTLTEHCAAHAPTAATGTQSPIGGQAVLDQWLAALRPLGLEHLAKRLQWDHFPLDPKPWLSLRGEPLDLAASPTWMIFLSAYLDSMTRGTPTHAAECRDTSQTDSFPSAILEPLVEVAIDALRERLGSQTFDIVEPSLVDARRLLEARLTEVASPVLQFELSIFSSRTRALEDFLSDSDTTRKRGSRRFIESVKTGRLGDLVIVYPVWARTLCHLAERWVDQTAEIVERLLSDADELSRAIGNNLSLESLTRVQPGLSDPHNGGRTVCVLQFADGTRLVYKPRDIRIDAAFQELLTLLNAVARQHGFLELATLRSLPRDGYGWMEYAIPAPCADSTAAERFYRRSGMWLALLYVFGFSDIHSENLIASGEHPIVIDLETCASPMISAAPSEDSTAVAVHDSVLRTGMLPTWDVTSEGIAYDVSALGDYDGYTDGGDDETTPSLFDVGTFDVRRWHLPQISGQMCHSTDFVDHITAGFVDAYELLQFLRPTLLGSDGAVASLGELPTRFIFRPTRVYHNLLKSSITPDYMRSGLKRSVYLDGFLVQALLYSDRQPPEWPLVHQERSELEQFDIPVFLTRADSVAIHVRELRVHTFATSGTDGVTRRLERLGDADKALQLDLIRSSLAAKSIDGHQAHTNDSTGAARSTPSGQNALKLPDLTDEAVRIASHIERMAMRSPEGTVSWLGLTMGSSVGKYWIGPVGSGLYSGRVGIAYFLSALGSAVHDERWRLLALSAIEDLRSCLRSPSEVRRLPEMVGLGLGGGVSGLIFGLTRIATFANDESLVSDARKLANAVTLRHVEQDDTYDVIGGAAGAILALMALYDATEDSRYLAIALDCAHHLWIKRQRANSGHAAWRDRVSGQCLTGFAHGASGICHSLARLAQVVHERWIVEMIEEGLRYESSLYSVTRANWPDLRGAAASESADEYMCSWCHGAPGVGLARLGLLKRLGGRNVDAGAVERDARAALATTVGYGIDQTDHICCGNLGRADFILEAGRHFGEASLEMVAKERVGLVCAKARERGRFAFSPVKEGANLNFSLFSGLAGIGYNCLRSSGTIPSLPSVLVFD